MPQQIILFVLLALSSHILRVRSDDCVREYVDNQFKSFIIQPEARLNNFQTNGSNFYILADAELGDLELLEHSGTIDDWIEIQANLSTPIPYFSIAFSYNCINVFVGTHVTNGTILSRRRFSGSGKFNATVDLHNRFLVDVKIQPSASGYLDIPYMDVNPIQHYLWLRNETIYLENVTDNEAIKEYREFITEAFHSITLKLVDHVLAQILLQAEQFWRNIITDTYLTDICITPVLD